MLSLPELLRKGRLKAGLTALEVAKTLGVSETTMSRYELGERIPDNEKLKDLAKLYKVSTDCLIDAMVGSVEVVGQPKMHEDKIKLCDAWDRRDMKTMVRLVKKRIRAA